MSEQEEFILAQCIATPEVIPYVAKALRFVPHPGAVPSLGFWDKSYRWSAPAYRWIWDMIFEAYTIGHDDVITALANISWQVNLEKVHAGENRRREAIEQAQRLVKKDEATILSQKENDAA